MAQRTINGVPLEQILKPFEDVPGRAEAIPGRSNTVLELAIVEPDPEWPGYFDLFKSRIISAFETSPGEDGDSTVTVLSVNHVGSTSVPELPAKAVIDIDLVLSSTALALEPFYVPRLQAAGFEFRIREEGWHGHRFFRTLEPIPCNLHVWGPRCPEAERHRIFRDHLRTHDADRALYARIKRESARQSKEKGEDMMQYTVRKNAVVQEILTRAFGALGFLDDDRE